MYVNYIFTPHVYYPNEFQGKYIVAYQNIPLGFDKFSKYNESSWLIPGTIDPRDD